MTPGAWFAPVSVLVAKLPRADSATAVFALISTPNVYRRSRQSAVCGQALM